MPDEEQDWEALKESWATYQAVIEKWLDAATDPAVDAGALDTAVHAVIMAHSEWAGDLGEVLAATHTH